ncbi:hypothetical protein QWY77_03920 [Thalassotalea ponticola]|uniref:hypothetical protein n=1 Tax=Thalassotalea ponticola TaxID=1523392 RepID=UPI0025B2F569|nr:hypothetical protein [Thalassotalea ponticola]MDN3651913.1 hypothetical protein [Thalassotalea ponticola]
MNEHIDLDSLLKQPMPSVDDPKFRQQVLQRLQRRQRNRFIVWLALTLLMLVWLAVVLFTLEPQAITAWFDLDKLAGGFSQTSLSAFSSTHVVMLFVVFIVFILGKDELT